MSNKSKRVTKYTLDNGLTILVCPKKLAPKVSLQLWYNVGSKHEATGQKGMAHFIEHMIFKGTNDMLSESDINMLTQKLSGYTNAFTSYDYTGYLFDIPVANWDKVLPVFADCMKNCTFDQEYMNSEVKAVIQELKMYRDDYTWTLADALVTTIFESHPYHHPIIGYKQDLWSLERQNLLDFYKKYYIPQNATLIIVGDVDPDDVYQKVTKVFGSIPRGQDIVASNFYINDEVQSKTITLYRSVEQASCMLAFMVPGAQARNDYAYDVIGYILAHGKASRLQRILVDEKQLAVSISAMNYDLFDREIFFIEFKPKKEEYIAEIKKIILEQIDDIVQHGLREIEFRRALKLAQVEHEHMLESTEKQAYAIGKSFLAIGDQEYPFTYADMEHEILYEQIIEILKHYFRPTVCHLAAVVNVSKQEEQYVEQLQKGSDELDTKILFGKERISEIAPIKYVNDVTVNKLEMKSFVAPTEFMLDNGLKVLLHKTNFVDTVEASLHYKVNRLYDPKEYEGIGYLVSKMMLEGTSKYIRSDFIKTIESYGITITTTPGQIDITMLKDDIHKGFEFIGQMVQHAMFDVHDFERIKSITKAKLKQFWDTPTNFASQVAAEHIYKNHSYAHMVLGTDKTLDAIDRDICYNYYKKNVSPHEATLAIVGNVDESTIKQIIQEHFNSWTGDQIADIVYPKLSNVSSDLITVKKNRDQVVLAFAGLSVDRLDMRYDKLLIFDQILSRGMSSRLFALREQSGLFYTIGGSLIHGSGKQPGMIFFKTIVSKDRLYEAQKAIENCLSASIDTVTDAEFEEAQEVIVNTFPTLYESNDAIASTFLFLDTYQLPFNYFEKRISTIRSITKQEMIHVVKELLDIKKLIIIQIGRL